MVMQFTNGYGRLRLRNETISCPRSEIQVSDGRSAAAAKHGHGAGRGHRVRVVGVKGARQALWRLLRL